MFQPPTWSVTNLTRFLRDLLEAEEDLQDLWVEGEVSNLSRPSSGHLYFTLKDRNASLRCVMWRNAVMQQAYLPRNGDAIEIHGSISIYEAGGNYQLYGDLIRPAGEGALYQEFMRLKAQLEAEGLFDPQRKLPIPSWPRTIGIVTSPTGAALQDMLDTIRRRFPPLHVILSPTQVQGEQAPQNIVSALQDLIRLVNPDLILLARGGGSLEDLMAFNDEQVARAIASSPIPIITGIGHETDFTIADFAADLRAPTPTAAAELATPNRADLRLSLEELNNYLGQLTQNYLYTLRRQLESQQNRLRLLTPRTQIRRDLQRLDELTARVGRSLVNTLKINHTSLASLQMRLNALNPQAVLERGYAMVTQTSGEVVRSINQVQPNEDLQVKVSDGQFDVRVKEANSE
ncbi:MAG: exodeoxyribonuclease VII large subunit [Anaerolineales bacterium]